MTKKWKPTFNQAALSEKRRRRLRKVRIVFKAVLFSLLALAMGVNTWKLHRRHDSAQQFIPVDATHSVVLGSNPDGVPAVLNINGQRWQVIQVEGFEGNGFHAPGELFKVIQAETDCAERTITYIEAEDRLVLRTNLWHEVMHAGACLHGGDTWWNSIHPTNNVHPGIKNLGEFMADFSKTNPQFMIWSMY